jgi:GTP-binding protein
VKIRSAVFQSSSVDFAACPPSPLPEFAFIGRSNVGKSSMINMLTNRKDLAKVSSTPGKTSLINFFTINECWSLVDLPGYGFAKVGQEERLRFTAMASDYLLQRTNLALTFVLIDSLLSPQKIDLKFLEWMVSAVIPFALVFTKADRISPTGARKNIAAFLERLQAIGPKTPEVVLSSSKDRQGQAEILSLIAAVLDRKEPA